MIPMSARDRQRRRKEEQRKRQEARRQEEERQRQLRLKGGATSASAASASASGRASGGAAASSSRSSSISSSAYRSSSAARTGIGSAAGTSSASRTVEEIRTARHRKIREQREEEEKRKRQAQIKEKFLKQHPEMAHCFEDSPLKPPKIPRPTVRSRDRSSSPEAPTSRAAAGRGTAKSAAAKASASAAGSAISRKKAGGWTSKSDFGGSNSRGTTRDREHSTSRTATAGKSRSREATSTGVSSSTTRALSGRGGRVPMEVDLSGGSNSSSASGGGREDRYSTRMDEPSPLDDLSLSPPASPGKKRKMTAASSYAVERPAYSSSYSGAGAASSTRKYDAASSYSGPSSSTQKKNVSSLPPSRRYYEESSDSDELYAYARAGDEARRRKKEAEEAAAAAAAEEARKKNKKRRSYSDSSSSEDDEEETGRGNDNKKMSSSAANKRTSRSSNDQSDSDSDFNEHLAKMKRDQEAKRPHNPLALQKMEEEKYASLARAKSAKLKDHRRRAAKKKGTSGDESDDDDSIADAGGAAKAAAAKLEDDDDGFFSDAQQREADGGNDSSDDDRKKKKRVKAKSTPRGVKRGASSSSSGSRAKNAGARSKASSSSNAAKKKSPAKKKSKTEDEDDKAKYDADMEELSDEDEDLENRLKPNFANPKFAVGALEPLEMTVTNFGKGLPTDKCVIESDMETTRHYVPSSISRYLQPYQREGIQFMHKIITDQSIPRGCILGDDMGLGKTVQIIGLLAAIQKKGGNDLDLKLLQQKRRRIAEELEAMQKREEDALLQGLPIPQSNKEDIYADARKSGRILVIVPASVVANWQNELKVWGHFSVAVYEGQNRRDALDRVREGRDEILVVGKPLFTKKGTDFPQINELDWRLVICDEMHEYKGHRTNGHKCLEELRNKSKCPVIGLTGTLIQNNYEELHTLVTLVQPGLIGDRKTFMEQTGKPLMNMRSKTATAAVIARGEKRKAELDKAMEMVYLHRKKIDVLKDDLTEKMQRVIFCELSDLQKRLYRHVLTLPDYHLLRTANTPCDCGVNQAFFLEFRRLKTTKEKLEYQRRKQKEVVLRKGHCYQIPHNPDRFDPDEPPIDPRAAIWSSQHDGAEPCDKCPSCVFLPALTKLYKICSHPSLLQADQDLSKLPRGSAEYDKTKKVLDFAKVAIPPDVLAKLPGGSYVRDASLMDDHLSLSGKMEVLDYCLHKFNQRSDRVLIFSYSTKTLDLIENCVKAHGYRFLRLDGSTSTRKRQTLVDKFQNDDSFKAFLISTKAGGLGLNLTAANKVIIFDVNWNPSYDEQAQDRAFRIGQQRDVEVIRLVSQGTVEELMYARQLYKVHLKQQALGGKDKEEEAARLFRGVVGDKNRKGELFGIENLLKFKDGSFMDDIWSSRKGKKGKHAAANEEDIASALSNAGGVDGVLNMGGTDEAEVQMLEEAAASENRRMSKGVNHEDFLSKHHGGAAIDQDDEGFEEEMGGASQMNYAVYEEGGGEVDTDEDEEKKEEEDEKKPAAKLSPIAEQRIKDDPDIEEVQSTRSPHQRDTGLGSAGTKGVAASSPVAATTAATSAASASPANAAASTSDSSKKKAEQSRSEREVNTSEASGAAVRSEPVAPEPMDEESPVAEVAASIMIINDAKKESKKKGGSPSKLSGLLHKPSYKKKKKKKKKDP